MYWTKIDVSYFKSFAPSHNNITFVCHQNEFKHMITLSSLLCATQKNDIQVKTDLEFIIIYKRKLNK